MSYDLPNTREYAWGQDNFGATSVVHYIVGPKGAVGFVRELSCDVTTAMAGNTTVPEIQVGISSGDTTYGRYRLGTAIGTGLGVGFASASDELITGNPPRNLQDYAHHVELDGYPTTTAGVAGGTFLTVVLAGRIPAAGIVVNNVTSSAAATARLFLRDPLPYNLVSGQLVNIRGVAGTFGGVNGTNVALSNVNAAGNWVEVTSSTVTAYTGGGVIDPVAVVTLKSAVGASTTGAGHCRVVIQWIGAVQP